MQYKRFLPLIILALLMLIAYLSGIQQYLSLEAIKEHRATLKEWVNLNPLMAPFAYMGIYAVLVALSIPGGVFLTLIGGFLFPQPFATLYVVIGATCGAIAVFLVAKTAIGDSLRERAGPRLRKMEAGLHENAASYLLFLRLVPIFPFWMVNIAPAVFGVHLPTYAWTTFVGIIPGAFAFAQAGAGLGAILDADETFSVAGILNTEMKVALLALGVVALIPIALKKWRGNAV